MSRHYDPSRELSDKEFDEQLIIDSQRQLLLTEDELFLIGFKKKKWPADELNAAKITYEIPCINGAFYCNEKEETYKWYQRIDIDGNSNYIHLDIKTRNDLHVLLSIFKIRER